MRGRDNKTKICRIELFETNDTQDIPKWALSGKDTMTDKHKQRQKQRLRLVKNKINIRWGLNF